MSPHNLLIVGGSGAIGTELIEKIEEYDVIYVIDRELPDVISSNCKFFQCDLNDSNSMTKIKDELPNDLIVLYLAANISNSIKQEDLLNSITDNIIALVNFITFFASKLNHLIYISSIAVYGIPKYNPIDEKHPLNPYSIYGATKACAENIGSTLCQQFNIPLTIIRTTQLFGLPSANNTLPHMLKNNMKIGKKIKISCDPNCKRDYLHISDFSSFINTLIRSPKKGLFNLGSGYGIKISDLFKIAYEASGFSFDLSKVLEDKLNPSFSQIMNIQQIQNVYGFQPKYQMKEWFKDNSNTSF